MRPISNKLKGCLILDPHTKMMSVNCANSKNKLVVVINLMHVIMGVDKALSPVSVSLFKGYSSL